MRNLKNHLSSTLFRELGSLLLLFFPLFLSAQNQSLTINLTDFPSNEGRAIIVVFQGKDNYNNKKPFESKSLEITNKTASWKLDSIPAGDYIVFTYQDENYNNKMDYSDQGMPEEAFAFSNNVQPVMGPPSPDKMLFPIKENENAVQNIKMLYYGIKTEEIKGVDVVADKKQMVKIDADKSTYQVKDNPTLTTGSIRDAVRKLPGIVLSPTGDLTLNGKTVSIYIDGIPSSLSGSDLKNYLESMPATTVEKIELIENPGASYEANTSGGIVNIITRSTSSINIGGSVNMHYGYSEGNSKLSPSMMLYGKKNKINWQLQTGYNWHQATTTTNVTQTHYSDSIGTFQFIRSSKQQDLTRNFYIRPMMNYRLTDNSYIVFNYNFNTANDQSTTTGDNYTVNYTPAVKYNSTFSNPDENYNHEFVLKYKTMLDSLGKSMQITGYYSKYHKTSSATSTQYSLSSTLDENTNEINLNLNNAYGKIDFELPFSKISFNTGAKIGFTNSHNLGKYFYGGFQTFDHTNENTIDFNYHQRDLAAYAEARKTFGKLSTTLGVRMENLYYSSKVASADTTISDNLTSVFPTVNLLYRFNQMLNLSGRYSRRISMPAYSELDPNSNGYFDSYTGSVGNQNLKPNFFDNYSLSLNAFNYVSLGSYLRYSKNISLTSTESDPNSLTSYKTSKDYQNVKMYGAYLALPVPFGLITKGTAFFKQPLNPEKMSYAYLYLACNFNDIAGYEYTGGNKPLWMFNINTHIVLPYEFMLDGNWFHMFKGNFQIYNMIKPMNFWMIDLSRKFFNDKFEITAEALKEVEQTVSFDVTSVNTTFSQRQDGMTYWLKLSYRFGSAKTKAETEINADKLQIEGGGIDVGAKK